MADAVEAARTQLQGAFERTNRPTRRRFVLRNKARRARRKRPRAHGSALESRARRKRSRFGNDSAH